MALITSQTLLKFHGKNKRGETTYIVLKPLPYQKVKELQMTLLNEGNLNNRGEVENISPDTVFKMMESVAETIVKIENAKHETEVDIDGKPINFENLSVEEKMNILMLNYDLNTFTELIGFVLQGGITEERKKKSKSTLN